MPSGTQLLPAEYEDMTLVVSALDPLPYVPCTEANSGLIYADPFRTNVTEL